MAIEEHWPVALEERDRAWLLDHTTQQFLCIEPDGVLDRDEYIDHRVVDNDTIVDGRNAVVRAEVRGDTGVIVNRAHFLAEDDEGERREIRILGSAST